jgi:hypothetical protein
MKLKICTSRYKDRPLYKGELVTREGERFIARSLSRKAVIASLREQSEAFTRGRTNED